MRGRVRGACCGVGGGFEWMVEPEEGEGKGERGEPRVGMRKNGGEWEDNSGKIWGLR